MTNPQLYIPKRVTVTDQGAVLRSELGYLIGFTLRVKANDHLRSLHYQGERSATERAMDAVKAQALTDLADELDPEHRDDTAKIHAGWGQRGDIQTVDGVDAPPES